MSLWGILGLVGAGAFVVLLWVICSRAGPQPHRLVGRHHPTYGTVMEELPPIRGPSRWAR